MTKKTKREIVSAIAVIALLVGYWLGSEIYYARSISPGDISTVGDFLRRFGEPRSVHTLGRDDKIYFEFTSRLPSAFVLAMPSAPPAYVFDEQGRFITWCSDPGDNPSYRQQWPFQSTNTLDMKIVRQKFGI